MEKSSGQGSLRAARLFAAVAAVLLSLPHGHAQPATALDGFEFVDKDIGEILYAASLFRGVPIVGDETVGGRMSFRFAGIDFDEAFDSFLRAEQLYVSKGGTAWTVSRVQFTPLEDGTTFLDASRVRPAQLLEKTSVHFREEITFDPVPEQEISLHTQGTTARDFAQALARQLGSGYECQDRDGHVHIARLATERLPFADTQREQVQVTVTDGAEPRYSVDVQGATAGMVLEALFSAAQQKFLFACDTGTAIRRARFDGTFAKTLELLCATASLQATPVDGIYYVIPQAERSNAILDAGREWRKYPLSYTAASKATGLLQERFGQQDCILLEDENAFLCFATPALHAQMAEFIGAFDTERTAFTVRLRYIRTEDVLAHLAPEFSEGQIARTTQDNVFFFSGTEAQFTLLQKQLAQIDRPANALGYDLLVMQLQATKDTSWAHSLSARRLSLGDRNNASFLLGSVLDLNLDVVSVFGLEFAASLQSAINENRAQVCADTTLHGISGGTINFKNTNTYRYRDNNLDPETGKPIYSGITREIASGLEIDVTGWVSGDGMITTKVTASVSRQGADLSASTGNPPPTSEKVITTEVLGKSGEPIILSGLIQNESALVEERTPVLSKIPLLGWLFKSHKKTEERTEMVIYLVPHWERHDGQETAAEEPPAEAERAFIDRVLAQFVTEGA